MLAQCWIRNDTPRRALPDVSPLLRNQGIRPESSRGHAGHSAFVLEEAGFRLLCDFGQNRRGMLSKIRPDAIYLSHAHPDHAWGLEEATDLPVYASEITHEILAKLPIKNRVVLARRPRRTSGRFV